VRPFGRTHRPGPMLDVKDATYYEVTNPGAQSFCCHNLHGQVKTRWPGKGDRAVLRTKGTCSGMMVDQSVMPA
jgi:hypothetical protein